ncbi:helix-turn-helix domain-containing protein [Hymenobacter sp. HMF4947]|uniref:Helix-turn-helix domain-containing protein n=1 Tax=Hymenobacter ginkgonis TaxID=2682976 RepID=A0A7K1T8M0_9BACT|nr:helix-turn-helix transcriptional regulator [Hymenobacter ginkgonis]MVN74745.1 helix-turn-helix domain-containing protein [Hymenobacter ginkgonis]
MLFQFGLHSALLLPFVVPGVAATLWLLGRALRRGAAADALLALLILLPTLSVAQWMLGYAGWFDSHDGHSTVMFYVPWRALMLLGPAYYLYFRSLTNQEFGWRRLRWHLLPGALELGVFAAVAAYDLLWCRALKGQALPDFYGTKGAAATALDNWYLPEALLGYALLLGYGLRMLAEYRRYRHYLNNNFSDPERLRFAGLRQLLVLQTLVLTLGLLFTTLNERFDFSYDTAWYFFALRGLLIYGLIVVGIQANYAAATSPLRFGAEAASEAQVPPAPLPLPVLAAPQPAPAAVPAPGPTPLVAAEETALPPAALPPELLPWRDKLLHLMATEQPWLEPELTLTELAQRLRTNSSLLSKVINTGCGQNFNDFVNTYRVQEARRKLADPRFSHYSLVGVALESGFNSKSTFNRVFKKLLGQAPSEVIRPK